MANDRQPNSPTAYLKLALPVRSHLAVDQFTCRSNLCRPKHTAPYKLQLKKFDNFRGSSYYDHANWCIIAEKVNVWTIWLTSHKTFYGRNLQNAHNKLERLFLAGCSTQV
jgi:hypothetical protein